VPSQNKLADSAIVTGSVKTQASAIVFTVPDCKPDRFANIVPATADDRTWVVDTGKPLILAIPIAAAAVI
jgi:hypothetical protein